MLKFLIRDRESLDSSNSRWQTHRERPNRFTDNGDMVNKGKRSVMGEVMSVSVYDF